MSSSAPPLPASLPPPPPGGALPPVSGIPPPPLKTPVQPFAPPSNVILLRNVPAFLRSFEAIREWLVPCGAVRTMKLFPFQDREESLEKKKEEEHLPSLALVTMLHGDGAWRLACVKQHITKTIGDLAIDLVPPSPDIPLPRIPKEADEATLALAQQLTTGWQSLRTKFQNVKETPTSTLKDSEDVPPPSTANNEEDDEDDDEEPDPLKAPEVLEAVRQFRLGLSKTQRKQQQERERLVSRKIQESMPEMKERLERERLQPASLPPPPLPPAGTLPPPPPPGGLPPPPPPSGGVPLPPPPVVQESGKRGVSNLPAWMNPDGGTAAVGGLPPPPRPNNDPSQPQGPPQKRPRLQLDLDTPSTSTTASTHFATLPDSARTALKEYVTAQIKEYLGEEEATLIDFCCAHVMDKKSKQALVEELQLVLEEDAGKFVEGLEQFVQSQVA